MNSNGGFRVQGSALRRTPLNPEPRTLNPSAIAFAALPFLLGCEWFSDFRIQPKVDTWEVVSTDSMRTRGANDSTASRGNPQTSVPITGTMMAGYQVSYSPMPAAIDSMAGLANPVAADERSLVNGKKYYQINCAPCHGPGGAGNGPVTKAGMPGISLLNDVTKGRSDGYIWGMMRNGRGLMPNYNRIEEMDRWDVVNYVRALQGRGAAAADTTWTVVPGETGDKVYGVTELGPTRPPPHVRPMPKAAAHDTTGAIR